jgi:hypothetical protein
VSFMKLRPNALFVIVALSSIAAFLAEWGWAP